MREEQEIPTIIPNLLLIFSLLLPLPSLSSFHPLDNYLLTFTPMGPTLTTHHLLPLNNPPPLTSTLPFSFPFPISSPSSPHLLLLHFLPNSPTSPIFNVSASQFPLLPNFSPSPTSPTSLEFIFPVLNLPVLDLSFAPSASGIGAVELYSIPEDVVPEGVGGHVVEVVRRVNVGGPRVTPENDTMWRSWVPDGEFFEGEEGEVVVFTGRINYQPGGATREAAPECVYGTARELKMNRTENSSSATHNLTWVIPVPNSDHGYLLRLHFCDIVSKALNELYFNIYINGYSAYKDVDLSSQYFSLASPYYIDSLVDSNPSGTIQISVGPSNHSQPLKTNAILNGFEIMKINEVAKFSQPKKKNHFGVLVGSIIGCLLVLSCVVLAFLMIWVRLRRRRVRKQKPIPSYNRLMELSVTNSLASDLDLSLKIAFSEILLATNNFDESFLVGSGGFGKVYRGVLRDGTVVAVKRGGCGNGENGGSRQGLTEFQAEILVLSKIRHRHLVSLIGYCNDKSEMILVYEYVKNGTLKEHLHGSTTSHLSWKQRLEICIGSARGLHYLHTGTTRGVVIHRDVKSANILLDEDYTAKVADFGLSRSAVEPGEARVSTGVKGSFGYFDPEYFRTQQLTDKSDVYSFGVVLLEVLCARHVIDRSRPWEEVNLAEWGMKWQKKGKIEKVVDEKIKGEIDCKSLEKYGVIVEKCLAQYGVDRPSMGDVLWNLECILQLHEASKSSDGATSQMLPKMISENGR